MGWSRKLYQNAALFRWALSSYGPYWGAGIRVAEVAPDFSRVVVTMKPRFWNRNAFGTHFGGSLYSMCDPFYCLMLVALLGKDYVVWDKAAAIEFIKPAKGTVHAVFTWSRDEVEAIRAQAANGEKVLPLRVVDVVDEAGVVVAQVHKTLYVRTKRPA